MTLVVDGLWIEVLKVQYAVHKLKCFANRLLHGSTLMRRKHWIAAAAVSGLLAAGLAAPAFSAAAQTAQTAQPAAGPQGCTVHGDYEVCLLDPTQSDDGQDLTIENRLLELVDSAEEGDSIRVSLYTWTRTELAEALVAAHDDGVDVRIVLDGINEADQNDAWMVLSASDIPLTSCQPASCLGTNINHTKLFLFDIAGVQSTVVSSSNMTTTQSTLHNNLLKVDGDEALYDFMEGYWNRMEAQSWTHDGVTWGDEDKHLEGDLETAGYVYPRESDDMLWMLESVTACREGNDQVWVAASLWTSPREAVRDRLAEMQDDLGCDVKVVAPDQETMEWVQQPNSGGQLDSDKVGYLESNHNKLFLINAEYLGEWQEVVFTGSHNLTGTSVATNDEATVRVADADVAAVYGEYFDAMFDIAGGV